MLDLWQKIFSFFVNISKNEMFFSTESDNSIHQLITARHESMADLSNERTSNNVSNDNSAENANESDDDEEFDAYLQEYIDMYTNPPLNGGPSYEAKREEIVYGGGLDASETDQEEELFRCAQSDSSYKRKHHNQHARVKISAQLSSI